MFDKKGRWWPQRPADKQARKQWKTARKTLDGCPGCQRPGCEYVYETMRNLGREAPR